MLSYDFNSKIIKLAPRFTAKAFAPHNFETLKSNMGEIVVWEGASDNTIYGEAGINHAFRAWHDSLHIKLNAGFDLEGETRVAIEQARQVESDTMAILIMAEVVGQIEYHNKYGKFPVDQVEFIRNYLKGKT